MIASSTTVSVKLTETAEADTERVTDETSTENGTLPSTANLTVPVDADAAEIAAIVAAVGTHRRNCTENRPLTDSPQPCDRWKLHERLGGRKPPREVARGEEWKAVARSR